VRLKVLLIGTALALVLAAPSAGASRARGHWIVFSASPQHATQNPQLFRVRPSGSGLRQITTGRAATDPAFSPNGRRIAFARLGSGIFTINADGTGLRRLTGGTNDRFPVYSPDGTQIAFLRAFRGDDHLYVMRAGGGGLHRLRPAPSPAGRPSWTPDSQSIFVPVEVLPESGLLYQVDARTGRAQKQLPVQFDAPVTVAVPTVAPNGRTLAFVARRPSPPDCEGVACEVFGLDVARITGGAHAFDDGGPAGWSPSGKMLAYAARGSLYVRPVGGGAGRAIPLGANVISGDTPPAWQP
jgi:Tol biopolymer transport system component